MADIAVTAASVLPTTTTVYGRGITAVTVTAGQTVYSDLATSGQFRLATNTSAATALLAGIAMHGATAGQPLIIATAGDVTFNAVLTAATAFVLGSVAGGISASADLDASTGTRFGSVLGMATTTTNLLIQISNSGVLNP
jgi:hypothetical protein